MTTTESSGAGVPSGSVTGEPRTSLALMGAARAYRGAVDIALREIRYGRVWRVNACRLVDERDGVLALWSPAGIPRLVPVDDAGEEIRIPLDEPWVLGERTTALHSLALLDPRTRHSLWLHWDEEWAFRHWYVNFERWLGRGEQRWTSSRTSST